MNQDVHPVRPLQGVMEAVLRRWREVLPYLLVFCTLLLAIAAARGKPSINLYVVDREGRFSQGSAGDGASGGRGVPIRFADGNTTATSEAGAAVEEVVAKAVAGEVAGVDAMPVGEQAAAALTNGGRLQDPEVRATVDAAALDHGLTHSLTEPKQKLSLDPVAVLNGYDATELQAISGIGPALANRIVEYRESIGGFESLDELLEVSGIGAVKLSQIERHLNQLFGR